MGMCKKAGFTPVLAIWTGENWLWTIDLFTVPKFWDPHGKIGTFSQANAILTSTKEVHRPANGM